MQRKHSAEVLAAARKLYNSGVPLSKAAIEVKVPYATLYYHAWLEGWAKPKGNRNSKLRAIRFRQNLEREERRLNEELAIRKAEEVEVLARRSLSADSARTRMAIRGQVDKLVKELEGSEGLTIKERAQTLSALANVMKVLQGIESESGENGKVGVINLALINTSPEQLRALGGRNGEGPES